MMWSNRLSSPSHTLNFTTHLNSAVVNLTRMYTFFLQFSTTTISSSRGRCGASSPIPPLFCHYRDGDHHEHYYSPTSFSPTYFIIFFVPTSICLYIQYIYCSADQINHVACRFIGFLRLPWDTVKKMLVQSASVQEV